MKDLSLEWEFCFWHWVCVSRNSYWKNCTPIYTPFYFVCKHFVVQYTLSNLLHFPTYSNSCSPVFKWISFLFLSVTHYCWRLSSVHTKRICNWYFQEDWKGMCLARNSFFTRNSSKCPIVAFQLGQLIKRIVSKMVSHFTRVFLCILQWEEKYHCHRSLCCWIRLRWALSKSQ